MEKTAAETKILNDKPRNALKSQIILIVLNQPDAQLQDNIPIGPGLK